MIYHMLEYMIYRYIYIEREKIELLTCKLNHQELNVYILKHVLRLEE